MAECLHLYFCLKAGFELEGKVVIPGAATLSLFISTFTVTICSQ